MREPRDRYLLPGALLAAADAAVFAGLLLLGLRLRATPAADAVLSALGLSAYADVVFDLRGAWPVAAAVAGIGLLTFQRFGIYRRRTGFQRHTGLSSYAAAVAVTYIFLAAVLFGAKLDISRAAMALSAAGTVAGFAALSPATAALQRFLVRRNWGFRRALLAAPLETAGEVLAKVQRFHGSYFQVVGVVPETGSATQGAAVQGVPVVGTFERAVEAAQQAEARCLLIALPTAEYRRMVDLLRTCARVGLEARVVPDLFDALTSEIEVGTELDAIRIVTLDAAPLDGTNRWLKRMVDLIVGGTALVVSAPVMGLLAVLIKLDSAGPAFYTQERVGSDGRVFRIVKLRTMRADAERNAPGWTVPGDPRITRLGRWLRRFNLDELPQLVNVVRGEMSLVGPRPERPEYVNQFKRRVPQYMRRHLVKSGITGLAQIAGLRGNTSIDERTRYDLYYIEHWSLWLDFRILLRTLWAWQNAY